MKGSLEILEVLMCLDDNTKNSTLSGTIRKRLGNQNLNTLNSRLDRLSRTIPKIIEKVNRKELGEKLIPGGDKIKYKLTKDGIKLKEQLIKQATNVLLLDQDIKKEILRKILTAESNKVLEIIDEFSKELDVYSSGKELTVLKKKLKSVLSKHLL